MSFEMNFEKVRDSVISYLGSKQGTNWRTIRIPGTGSIPPKKIILSEPFNVITITEIFQLLPDH